MLKKAKALPVTFLSISAILLNGCGSNGESEAEENNDDLMVQEIYDLLPEEVQDSGVLTVATDPQYPPCDFINDDGEIDGFNHDLLMAMEPRMGVDIEQEAISFDGLIPGVESGRFPAAKECISETEERREIVDFVNYAYATKSLILPDENTHNITENPLTVCGLHAGAQTGTEFADDLEFISENCEQEGQPPVEVTHFPSAGDQNTAIDSGQIDFAITNTATGVWQNEESGGQYEIVANPLLAKQILGMVVGKGEDDLAQAFYLALDEIIEDGTYMEIMEEWGLEEIAIEEPGINLAESDPPPEPELCGACGYDND